MAIEGRQPDEDIAGIVGSDGGPAEERQPGDRDYDDREGQSDPDEHRRGDAAHRTCSRTTASGVVRTVCQPLGGGVATKPRTDWTVTPSTASIVRRSPGCSWISDSTTCQGSTLEAGTTRSPTSRSPPLLTAISRTRRSGTGRFTSAPRTLTSRSIGRPTSAGARTRRAPGSSATASQPLPSTTVTGPEMPPGSFAAMSATC